MRNIEDINIFPLLVPTIHHRHKDCTIGYTLMEDVCWNGINIPKGFDYDGATVPQLFWSLVGGPFHPRVMKAALIHDWVYLTNLISREEADKILYKLLLEAGFKEWRAKAFYYSVVLFGGLYYKQSIEDQNYLILIKNMLINEEKEPELFKLDKVFAL